MQYLYNITHINRNYESTGYLELCQQKKYSVVLELLEVLFGPCFTFW